MIAAQDIIFGVTGQTLDLDAEDGPITSVTSVTVYYASSDDTAQPVVATTGSATIDAVSTTLATTAAGASAADPTLVTVTSATGILIDHRYQIANASGQSEVVEVVGKNGVALTVRSPLKNEYPITTSTFKAFRATIAVDSTFVAATQYLSPQFGPNARYRVRWVVVIAGVTRVYDRYFDLVRYPASHGVTPQDVEDRFPGWLDSLPVDRQADQGRSLVDRAAAEVKFDLYQDNKADTAIRSNEIMSELVIARAQLLRLEDEAMRSSTVDERALSLAKAIYDQRYNSMIRAPVAPVSPSGGGGSAPVVPMPLVLR